MGGGSGSFFHSKLWGLVLASSTQSLSLLLSLSQTVPCIPVEKAVVQHTSELPVELWATPCSEVFLWLFHNSQRANGLGASLVSIAKLVWWCFEVKQYTKSPGINAYLHQDQQKNFSLKS